MLYYIFVFFFHFPFAGVFLRGFIHSVKASVEICMTSVAPAPAFTPLKDCPQLRN